MPAAVRIESAAVGRAAMAFATAAAVRARSVFCVEADEAGVGVTAAAALSPVFSPPAQPVTAARTPATRHRDLIVVSGSVLEGDWIARPAPGIGRHRIRRWRLFGGRRWVATTASARGVRAAGAATARRVIGGARLVLAAAPRAAPSPASRMLRANRSGQVAAPLSGRELRLHERAEVVHRTVLASSGARGIDHQGRLVRRNP